MCWTLPSQLKLSTIFNPSPPKIYSKLTPIAPEGGPTRIFNCEIELGHEKWACFWNDRFNWWCFRYFLAISNSFHPSFWSANVGSILQEAPAWMWMRSARFHWLRGAKRSWLNDGMVARKANMENIIFREWKQKGTKVKTSRIRVPTVVAGRFLMLKVSSKVVFLLLVVLVVWIWPQQDVVLRLGLTMTPISLGFLSRSPCFFSTHPRSTGPGDVIFWFWRFF